MCDFGDDVFSQFVLAAAKHEGIEDGLFQLHPFPVRRVSAAFSFAHDRGFVSFMDDVAQTSPVPLIERHRPRCVFLPHLHYGAPSEWPSEGDGQVYADLFACARAQGAVIFMDCQSTDATLEAPGVVEALQAVDVFAPNEVEALQLTGAATVEQALARLAELTPLVIVKRGAEGAIAGLDGGVVQVPAIPVEVVDTTGAGDCFNAGFLYGYLRGASLETCLRAGNICGGLSTTAIGGRAAAPTAAQVEEYLRRYPAGV